MLKEDEIIALYSIVDDLLKGIHNREPLNRKVFDSEVITTALGKVLSTNICHLAPSCTFTHLAESRKTGLRCTVGEPT